jgi:hypothetical protein
MTVAPLPRVWKRAHWNIEVSSMTLWLRVLAVAILLGAFAPRAAGICLPTSTRFTKCVDGKVADCTRSRDFKCKTRLNCTPTEQPCEMPLLPAPGR